MAKHRNVGLPPLLLLFGFLVAPVASASATGDFTAGQTVTLGSTPTLIADVQEWVDGTANVGWALLGSGGNGSVRGYGSSENGTVAARPVLSVTDLSPVDLTIAKSDVVDPVLPNANITYTLSVTNHGESTATGTITVSENLDDDTTFVSASGSGWACGTGDSFFCTRTADLAGGATTPAITVVATAPGTLQTVTNHVSVSTPDTESNTGNNSASETTTIATGADLQITKAESADPTQTGTTLEYTLNVTNGGPDTATTVTVTDTLPTGFSATVTNSGGFTCGQSLGVITCTLAAFPPGGNTSIVLSGTAPSSPTTLTNMATIASDTFDPDHANNSTSITTDIVPQGQMESDVVIAGDTHVTVNLVNTYVDPIVVATVQYANNTLPVLTRVSNVTPTSFDLRLQNPSGAVPLADNVSYWVVERGVWTIDGVKLEANKYLSTQVDRKGAWLGVPQTYGQAYAQPVVLGQVMTENDPRWSVFFAQGANHFQPPDATTMRTGRHVGEDPVFQRANEIVGYIVVEAVHTNLAGVEFEAALGPDTVQGVQNGPPFPYNFNNPFGSAPTVAVVASAGMDGGDGGWAQLHGPTMATTTQLRVSIDEDQVGDPERSHTTEQVAYAAFGGPMVSPAASMCTDDADCQDGSFCNGAEVCDANQVCRPGPDPCPGQPCTEVAGDDDDSDGACLAGGLAQMESVVVPAGGTKSAGHLVQLTNTYVSPVIACTPVYDGNSVPVVVRISQVTGDSFVVGLQNPGDLDPVTHDPINCLVVEQGSWEMDGHPVEAQKYLSVTTDKERNWLGTAQALIHGFTHPVILGSVMSSNDPLWSVYWQRGAAQNQPPSATELRNGKTICEDDPTGDRADEIVGFIVFEQSNGTIGGVEFEAALGPDTVQGIDNGPPFDYTFNVPFDSPPSHVIATQAGMDGSDGSWAYLFGNPFSTTTTLSLAVDEDQIFNDERGHTTEQVAYVAFESQVVFPRPDCTVDDDCDDGNHCNGAETCDLSKSGGSPGLAGPVVGTCAPGIPVVCDDGVGCTDDSCNETTDSCDFVPSGANCDNGLFCDGEETCNATLDCQAGEEPCNGAPCDEELDTCPGSGPQAQMEWGTVGNVGGLTPTKSGSPDKGGAMPVVGTRVNLVNDYVDPVVVVSIRYFNNLLTVVPRVTNVFGTSFDVYLQDPSGRPVLPETIDYIVVEQGTWIIDGVPVEAQKYLSTETAHDGDWSRFDSRTYGQPYINPVVLGQVMSVNDTDFSLFWSRGSSKAAAPDSANLNTGKMVGEDPNTVRADEIVGFIVIEAGHGFIDGIEFEAGVSTDSVQGVANSPPYTATFATSFASPPQVAIATQTAMDGGNGGWMYTFGATPATTTRLNLAGDEDQLSDAERSRTTEQAAYIVFQQVGFYP